MPPLLPREATLQVVRSAVRDAVAEELHANFPGAVLWHGERLSPICLEGGHARTIINGDNSSERTDSLGQQRTGTGSQDQGPEQ